MSVSSPLPPLTPEQSAHSAKLLDRVRDEIDANCGWISFERFMEMALYEPGLGYYSAGALKFGEAGDFVTAPELSPLFSRCIANQCAEIFAHIGPADILELGAGSGAMGADILSELQRLDCLPRNYFILEVSADLRERQRSRIAQLAPELVDRVHWLEHWPTGFRGVMLANEVLDAQPVQRFRIRKEQVNAVGVTWQLGRLDWSEVEADESLESAVRAIERELGAPLPDGYGSEINVRLSAWIKSLAASIDEGVVLFIDYGLPRRQYYRAERREGTLLCHYRHRFHEDPLTHLGVQDIGAWVDFTAVAEAAVDAGMRVLGFTTQAHFLIGNGIERFLAPLQEEDLAARVQVARQAMLLTLPGEMGERFKVIGLGARYEHALSGFSIRDLAAGL